MRWDGIIRWKATRFGLPVIAVLLFTLFLEPVHERISTVTIALAFLLLVLFSATFFGRNPALVASFAAMLCFNYYFLPPVGSFRIADPQNLITWAAFTITAIIAGELSAFARRRATEAERQRLEIEKLYSELRQAFELAAESEALKRSEKLKSSLLDAVTHDLRTPLTSIKASVTTLLESEGGHRTVELDAESRLEFLYVINEETDRLNGFIEEMVEMARIQTNAPGREREVGDVNIAINSAMDRAEKLTEKHRIMADLENSLPAVGMDTRALAEVIYSLIDNAVKYSKAGSQITIDSRQYGSSIEITVNDQGPGIPEDMREKVFDKFSRLQTSNASGMGLGLSIARGLVESNDGSIRLEAGNDGTGTRAVVTLPVFSGRE